MSQRQDRVAWNFARRETLIPARKRSATSALEPVVAATLAWIWLGETLSGWQMLGGTAVLLGVVLLQIESKLQTKRALETEAA